MRSLIVLDYWEKLAGASLALSSIIRLCQHAGLALVAPSVSSSLFLPTGGWPLSAYYDLTALSTALAPQQLVQYAAWARLRRRTANSSISLAIVYSDFPRACTAAMGALATNGASVPACPPPCLAASGLRRLVEAARVHIGDEALSRLHCVRAAALRKAIQGGGGGLVDRLSQSSAIALLNFRRHDSGKPMLPPTQALTLRASAVRPAVTVRAAAHRFLRASHMLPASSSAGGNGGFALVQLRSNHLAHSSYLAAAAAQPVPPSMVAGAGGAASSSPSCRQRVSSCVRRLGRAARRLAPPESTVVASDIATLFEANQDGESHRRHPYMRDCLAPSLPTLQRWQAGAGRSFDRPAECAGAGAAATSTVRTRMRRRRNASLACDAGYLGLVDLALASEARGFVAMEVRHPWRSAFLEWIVQTRRLAGKTSQLINC